MNQTRSFLLIALLILGIFLWQAWQQDYGGSRPKSVADHAAAAAGEKGESGSAVPSTASIPNAVPSAPASSADIGTPASDHKPVIATTDVLRVELDPNGGAVIRAQLLKYRVDTQPGAAPVELMTPNAATFLTAQTGLVSTAGDAPSHEAPFQAAGDTFTLADGMQRLEVPFVWNDGNGLTVRRIYVFERDSYTVTVRYEIENRRSEAWQASIYRQLQQVPPPSQASGFFASPENYAFAGAAWYSPQDKFQKIKFADFPSSPLDRTIRDGWVALVQHYFLAAWIPPAGETTQIGTTQLPGSRYLIRELSPSLPVALGSTVVSESRLFIGPKLQDRLAAVAPGLELTVDYGIFTVIAQPLFWLLSALHTLLGNWGWAIVALVVLIKLALFKLSETQYKSFAKMRRVQPRIEALKERYGDDRQKFQMAMMELYKKEKINPMGGCLPILVQIPIFMALYWVLVESVELRHAPWMLWIHNLTDRDPYFVLPALNMLAMIATQKLSPAPGMDPMQKKMMQAMPLVFGVMFAFFPAGLVLYWTTNGLLGLLQQWIIMRRHAEPAKAS